MHFIPAWSDGILITEGIELTTDIASVSRISFQDGVKIYKSGCYGGRKIYLALTLAHSRIDHVVDLSYRSGYLIIPVCIVEYHKTYKYQCQYKYKYYRTYYLLRSAAFFIPVHCPKVPFRLHYLHFILFHGYGIIEHLPDHAGTQLCIEQVIRCSLIIFDL